ncbi:DDB1- and CUL4-associated factor 10-like [Lineus longissimus]|uniref:DDB1- and CUL4-associated factor 10-like n=1 Tax=Lineus longissimus TaxID=88925 RepID=UPI002B4F95DA
MPRVKFRPHEWLASREVGGGKNRFPCKSELLPGLYGSVREVHSWNPQQTVKHTHHGGIFNFDFSTDGSVLAAACERRNILLFDPFNGKLIAHKEQAHEDCVNYVRFLDTRVFATCSDDTTVCLWDVRFLKKNIRVLRGHSNWVKNIEYDANNGLLVTSGFDGSIYTWDINSYSSNESCSKSVFHTSGLMRSKLTPDASKLILSTAGGYLLVVHNLDLHTLDQDLHGFKPNMYRLMQMSRSPVRQGYTYNHVFERQRNRVEFISDFPEQNDAEVVASLQVHPFGWCVLSRNTSSDENSEWTCVHDIQAVPSDDDDDEEHSIKSDESDNLMCKHPETISPESGEHSRSPSPSRFLSVLVEDDSSSSHSQSPSPRLGTRSPSSQAGYEHETYYSVTRRRRTASDSSESSTGSNNVRQRVGRTRGRSRDSDEDIITEVEPSGTNHEPSPGTSNDDRSARSSERLADNMTFIIRSDSRVAERTLLLLGQRELICGSKPQIHENRPRLLHHIEEPNVGRGFIKELCFSSDGRLVCSPFAYGTRLLAFDKECHELCDAVPQQPQQLVEVASCMSHRHVVVTTKFSPIHCMFVSGCLNGKVAFHQPLL